MTTKTLAPIGFVGGPYHGTIYTLPKVMQTFQFFAAKSNKTGRLFKIDEIHRLRLQEMSTPPTAVRVEYVRRRHVEGGEFMVYRGACGPE